MKSNLARKWKCPSKHFKVRPNLKVFWSLCLILVASGVIWWSRTVIWWHLEEDSAEAEMTFVWLFKDKVLILHLVNLRSFSILLVDFLSAETSNVGVWYAKIVTLSWS